MFEHVHERMKPDHSQYTVENLTAARQTYAAGAMLLPVRERTPWYFMAVAVAAESGLATLAGQNEGVWRFATQLADRVQQAEAELTGAALKRATTEAAAFTSSQLDASGIPEGLATMRRQLATRQAKLDARAFGPPTDARAIAIEGRWLTYAAGVGQTKCFTGALAEIAAGRLDFARALVNSPELLALVDDTSRAALADALREAVDPAEAEKLDLLREAVQLVSTNIAALRDGIVRLVTGRIGALPSR